MYSKPVNFINTAATHTIGEGEDEVYTLSEFEDLCKCGVLCDYDGYGHPVKSKLADIDIWILQSNLKIIPGSATHILWNRRLR